MINFKRLTQDDFVSIYRWLKTPHVKQFWYPDTEYSYEEITLKYTKRLFEGLIEMYIIRIDKTEIGFIQTYIVEDNTPFLIDGKAKGVDLFIGEKEYVHKRYGKDMLIEFLDKHVFNDETIEYAAIDPEVENLIAIKAYGKAGFSHVKTEISPYNNKETFYMVLSRSNFYL